MSWLSPKPSSSLPYRLAETMTVWMPSLKNSYASRNVIVSGKCRNSANVERS